MASAHEHEKIFDMIKDIKFAMMTSVHAESGALVSRPMGAVKLDQNGDLWFFTHASAHKVAEVASKNQVNLAYADPEDMNFVSISGGANIVRDKAQIEALWKPALKTWFPLGLDDPDIALLQVSIDFAEYWDSPSGAMIAFGMVKSAVTGQPLNVGENRKVDFH